MLRFPRTNRASAPLATTGGSERTRVAAATRGISLVELTMVLLIMGILAAVGAPRLISQLNEHSVSSVRTLIQTDLKAAQQEAITTSSAVTFSIDKTRNVYTVSAKRNGSSTVLRTVNVQSDPWNCQITSLLQGSTQKSVSSVALTINGAGVFAENLIINLASGPATARATIDAATNRVVVE